MNYQHLRVLELENTHLRFIFIQNSRISFQNYAFSGWPPIPVNDSKPIATPVETPKPHITPEEPEKAPVTSPNVATKGKVHTRISKHFLYELTFYV